MNLQNKNDLNSIPPLGGEWTLEICVDNIEAAIAAEKAGANRIELCTNLNEGGVTPSFAYIEYALQYLSIPVFPIIRPRGGDFLYTDVEFKTMKKDIIECKQLGCKGVVIGLLNSNGTIDVARTKILVDAADAMEVTFHRAFDRTKNMLEALEDVKKTGCKRILTSGLYENVNYGIHNLQKIVQVANNEIIIMPGSGVRSSNLEKLIATTKAKEFHSSSKTNMQSNMNYFNPNFNEQENNYQGVDVYEIMKMKQLMG